MFEEEYDKLSSADQEMFKNVIKQLLGKTYILSKNYKIDQGSTTSNSYYYFAVRNLDLIEQYLTYSGLQIKNDSTFGVVYLEDVDRILNYRLDKLTTQILLALRLIYDDNMKHLQHENYALTSVGAINQILRNAGITENKINSQLMAKSLQVLKKFQVIEKGSGQYNQDDTKIIILPTILFIVTAEKLTMLAKLIDSKEQEEEEIDD